MKEYLREKWRMLLAGLLFPLFFTVYFLYLCSSAVYYQDVLYMDALYLAAYAMLVRGDRIRFREESEKRQEMQAALESGKEEIRMLREEMQEQNDYVSKWIHEAKVPLAALELMNGRNPDGDLQKGMRQETERIRGLLRTMLMYGKMGSMENDVQYGAVRLEDAVREVVKGQSYFLIRENFNVRMGLGDCTVYTDRRWLVYILDQITANAVKYRKSREEYGEQDGPEICFRAERISPDETLLVVEDNGRGVAEAELPWLFDRGYTGGNLRNGDYRSTGMGLYFAGKAAKSLGIRIEADSEEGKWTRFTLRFWNNSSLSSQKC